MKKRKVAIFDIDGTIFRSSLLIELVEVMIENKLFDFSARKEYEMEENEWLDRRGDYESYINAVVQVFMKNIKGIAYEDFDRAAKIVIERYKNRTYRYTRDLISKLKKKKYRLPCPPPPPNFPKSNFLFQRRALLYWLCL